MSPVEFHRVLVTMDGSARASRALECALSICECTGAGLTALAVEARVLDEARQQAGLRGRAIRTELVPGHAAEEITEYARDHAHDLLVIGHSTADHVARDGHYAVMVVR